LQACFKLVFDWEDAARPRVLAVVVVVVVVGLPPSRPNPSPEGRRRGHAAGGVVVLGGADLRVCVRVAVLPAQLASFRQKRAKGDGAGAPKKAAKRKGPDVPKTERRPAQERPLEAAAALAPLASGAEENGRTDDKVHRTDQTKC